METYRCERLLRRADARVERDVAIAVEDGRIREVLPAAELTPERASGAVGLPGLTVPGLVDAHTHLRSAPAAGQSHLPGLSFEQWAYALGALTPLPPLADATAAAGELLRAGVTSAQIVLHSWGGREERLAELEAAAAAVESAGLRALIVLGFTDQAEYLPAGLDDTEVPLPHRGLPLAEWPALIREARELVGRASRRISLAIGPVAPQWCSDAALGVLAGERGELRVHTHLHESAPQRDWLGTGETPLARLVRFDLLGPFASVAHGVHLTAEEIRTLAERRAAAVHCPSSNAGLGVGTAAVAEWLRRGVEAGIGMDSQGPSEPDAFAEARAALRAAQETGDALTPAQALRMAALGGARAMGSDSGEIVVGAPADFIVLDTDCAGGAEEILETVDRSMLRRSVIDGETRFLPSEDEQSEFARLRSELAGIVERDAAARDERLAALAGPLGCVRDRVLEQNGGPR